MSLLAPDANDTRIDFGSATDSTAASLIWNTNSAIFNIGTTYSGGGAQLAFKTANNAERMRIDASGNVGIGTTTPIRLLSVAGSMGIYGNDSTAHGTGASLGIVNLASGGDQWLLRSGATGNTTPAGSLSFAASGGYFMTISSIGNVGIGDISPASLLSVGNGDLFQVNSSGIIAAITGLTGATGSYDLSGATSLKIPSAANPTVSAAGEIAYDTTDGQLIVGANARVIQTESVKIWSTTVASTSPAFIDGSLLKVPTTLDGYTVTAIRCSVQGGTNKVIAVEDESGNSSEDITCTTSVTSDDGSITNATYTAAEESYIDFGATSGAVDYVSISVFGNYTRE